MKVKRPAPFILVSTNHGTMIVNRNDFNLVENGGYGLGYQILNTSSFDQEEIDFALALLNFRRRYHGTGVLAIDCGANIGAHTIEWGKFMYGWGDVISFEAQEKIYYALAGNIILNNCLNVVAKNIAVGDSCGKINIPEPNYYQAGSFGSLELIQSDSNEFIGQEIDYSKTHEIEMVSIDSLGLKRIDLIKIDVEGKEERVLDGAAVSIQAHKPIMIIEKIKSNESNLKNFLSSNDYSYYPMGLNLLAVHPSDPVSRHLSTDGKSLNLE
jgi:FkbM family methyltransferase